MPTITARAELSKRQSPLQIIANPVCYGACNRAVGVVQSEGLDSVLCDVPGDFAYAMLAVYSCTSKYSIVNGNATKAYPYLYTPLAYCAGRKPGFQSSLTEVGRTQAAEALSSSLDKISSAAISCSSLSSSICAAFVENSLTYVPTYIQCTETETAAQSSSLPASSAAPVNSTATSSPTSTTRALSSGAIADIAAGSAIVGVILIIFAIFFFCWHRLKKKRRLAAADGSQRSQSTQEKAQLHSDEYAPHREEVAGSEMPRIVRTIEGLHEIEYHGLSKVRSEMNANEIAATELNAGGSSRVGTDRQHFETLDPVMVDY